jgi:hypothetical protein
MRDIAGTWLTLIINVSILLGGFCPIGRDPWRVIEHSCPSPLKRNVGLLPPGRRFRALGTRVRVRGCCGGWRRTYV